MDVNKNKVLIDPTSDCHVHTRLSGHGQGDMEDYVKVALSKGLKRLIFLEHLEVGIEVDKITWLTNEDFEYYFKEGEKLRGVYGRDMQILLGVEVGYNPENVHGINDFLSRFPWDYVGLSYH